MNPDNTLPEVTSIAEFPLCELSGLPPGGFRPLIVVDHAAEQKLVRSPFRESVDIEPLPRPVLTLLALPLEKEGAELAQAQIVVASQAPDHRIRVNPPCSLRSDIERVRPFITIGARFLGRGQGRPYVSRGSQLVSHVAFGRDSVSDSPRLKQSFDSAGRFVQLVQIEL